MKDISKMSFEEIEQEYNETLDNHYCADHYMSELYIGKSVMVEGIKGFKAFIELVQKAQEKNSGWELRYAYGRGDELE